ncbi:MAG TPA: deoxyribodipyrimidine photolyase, partial [Erythrobacter sp.]|nr:deoxyribodipyrimidine photolyase [Erythrobacter sp.]
MTAPHIVWLRRDLRMADHPALYAAAQAGPVIPVYVLDDDRAGDHAYGGASKVWLHHSLESLGKSYGAHNSRIVLRRGDAPQVLAALADETGATCIHAMRHYEPWWKEAEDELRDALGGDRQLCLYDGNYLLPPGSVTTGSGDPYKIYTPFAKSMLEVMPPRDPLPEPETLSSPDSWPDSDELADWSLLPTKPDWAGGIREFW